MEHIPEQSSEEQEQSVSEPLYEFPGQAEARSSQQHIATSENAEVAGKGEVIAQPPLDQNSDSPAPGKIKSQEYTQEDILKGRVYPPPPAFYEKGQVENFASQPQIAYPAQPLPQPAGMPQAPYNGMPSMPVAPFPPPYYGMPPGVYAPPRKKSRKWVWILVVSLIVVLLGSCGLCGWLFASAFGPAYQQAYQKLSGALNTTTSYYTNIQEQHYDTAYAYLAVQNESQSAFTKQAQSADTQFGNIQSFTPGTPIYKTDPHKGPDLTHFTIIVTVKRAQTQYQAHLQLASVQGQWKITSFDRI